MSAQCCTSDRVEINLYAAYVRAARSLQNFDPAILKSKKDPRLSFSLEHVDPRIHFALVCTSSSCPPIDLYTAENLEEELNQAGKTFLNGGGLILDKQAKKVSLSRVFLWYGKNFGKDEAERLRRLAEFVYDPGDKEFLKVYANDLGVDYQKYDWRLNRN